ncbi:uncharacterized protein PAE49_013631 isoform 2-T2 [Odontesthes bonariensis]
MTFYIFNAFIVSTVCQSFIFQPSDAKSVFDVIQPPRQTVNPDRSASISCEHTSRYGVVRDVRLYAVSQTDESLLCQKGMPSCNNVSMYEESPNKYFFILLNIGPEAMNLTYKCQISMEINDVDHTEKGKPTELKEVVETQTGQNVKEERCEPSPRLPHLSYKLRWILTGLLAFLFVYSCVVTHLYIRRMNSNKDCEDSTYVEMRKAPVPLNQHLDIY